RHDGRGHRDVALLDRKSEHSFIFKGDWLAVGNRRAKGELLHRETGILGAGHDCRPLRGAEQQELRDVEGGVHRGARNSRTVVTRCSLAAAKTASHKASVSRLSRPPISGSAPFSIATSSCAIVPAKASGNQTS